MTVTEIEKKDSKDDLYTDTTVLNPADLSDGELDDKEKDLGGKVLTVDVLDDQGNIKPPEPEKNAKGEYIIRTGSDAAHYLLSLRDDGDPSLTVRSFVIGTVFAAACSVMSMYSTVSSSLSVKLTSSSSASGSASAARSSASSSTSRAGSGRVSCLAGTTWRPSGGSELEVKVRLPFPSGSAFSRSSTRKTLDSRSMSWHS
jgi:hypothetical protein